MTEHLLVTQGKGLNIYRYTDKQNSNNKNHTCFEELKNKNEVVLMQQMELPGIKKKQNIFCFPSFTEKVGQGKTLNHIFSTLTNVDLSNPWKD